MFHYTHLNGLTLNGISDKISARKNLNIGDYVAYKPDVAENYMGFGTSKFSNENPSGSNENPVNGIPQDTDLKWRVLSINEDNSVDLIAETPISTKIHLEGALGFNNGVYLLNELCKKHYSNSLFSETARSINLEDIEKQMNEKGISTRDSQKLNSLKYKATKSFTGNKAYIPDVYIYAQKNLKGECSAYYSTPTTKTYIPISKNPTGNTLDIIQTDYSIEVSANYFNDENFYKLIFSADNLPNEHSSISDYEFDTPYFPDYWLATRSTRNSVYDYAEFGLRSINSNASSSLLGSQFSSAILFSSNGEEDYACLAVRPVVHLSSSVKLSEEGGSRNNPKTLSK